jgi:hypothetical protein
MDLVKLVMIKNLMIKNWSQKLQDIIFHISNDDFNHKLRSIELTWMYLGA